MKLPDADLLEACAEHLRAIPFARRVRFHRDGAPDRPPQLNLVLTDGQRITYAVDARTAPVTPAEVAALRLRTDANRDPVFVLAPRVGEAAAQQLIAAGIPFVDAGGNCYLRVGDQFVILVQGKATPATRKRGGRGWGATGYQVLFALLALKDLRHATIRDFATAAGIPRTTVARTLRNLLDDGILVRTPAGHEIVEPDALLDRWLNGYATTVRNHWLIGRYRTQDADPEALEIRVQETLRNRHVDWAWGGGAGAMRLTGYYRGPETVLHLLNPPLTLTKDLRALPADDGPLYLFEAPARYMLEGPVPETAHPLLVFTELATRRDERAREAAHEVWRRFAE